jgi:hypothetical protein
MARQMGEAAAIGSGGVARSAAVAEWDAAQAWRRRLALVGRVLVGVLFLSL